MAKKAKREHKLLNEFKAFITRGNVLDMAVGVIIGSAFGAIVTAVVNILMSICTWGLPGGINGLVTVLPAINDAQRGLDASIGLVQKINAADLQTLARALAVKEYGESVVNLTPSLIESAKTTILGKYTLHGSIYTYNMSAIIDWGSLINTFISFLIIALVLFIILKVAAKMKKVREDIKLKALEEYYKKHPEERPVPKDPGVPQPTTNELLTQIRDALVEKK